GFLDHIYPKLKEFYDFYNAKYSVYFPNYEFRTPYYKACITIAKFQEDDIKLL
ncbi:uncharacterized protein K441DRAFT_665889, partial [Cenococcum geophilum 1.58]|uniref:uncharacterized protein n=1 Tax=Cenococcum geophilum 1.58 TaxID=794803 RepID=UPI00358DDF40